jgi:glycosyltransferase involved in cell wall biosynthesis
MKIGIVSSIDESCGNATFSQHLIQNINKSGHSAIPIGLSLDLTQSLNSHIRSQADKEIKKICKEISTYDGVNIQFEAGLYGSSHRDIYRRLRLLLNANPNTTITLHATRFHDLSIYTKKKAIKDLLSLRLKDAISTLSRNLNNQKIIKNNLSYVKLCVKAKVKIITHTTRAQNSVIALTGYSNTYLHPIKFTDPNKVKPNREYWLKRLNLENEDYLIGVFGFISEYKGIQTAISALKFLPKEYKLLIIGRQHPRTIREHMLINPFLEELLKEIKLDEKNNLKSRIIFTNELEDSEFMELAATVDCAWLPYLETGQDGSGVASILFDLSKRVVASQCKVFDELFRLVPEYKCERFDIGNYMELAGKTINYFEYRNLNKRMSYSDESQTYLYLNLLSE